MLCFQCLADVVLAKQNKYFYEILKKQYKVLKDEPMISCDNIWFVLLTIFLRIYDDLMSD
jgi:hypothetical protein